jgi:Flagellar hook-length control protein FliK
MNVSPITPAAAPLRAQVIGEVEAEFAAAAPAASAAPAPDAIKQAVGSAKAAAAGRQASLSPLFADLAQAQSAPGLTAVIKAAINQILVLRTPSDGPLTADVVEQAVARSGLFLEARLAASAPKSEAAPPDLKAALLTLQQALAAEPAAEAVTPPPRIPPPIRGAALTPQAPVPASLPPGADLAVIVQHLGPQVERALARQVLHQLASAPDGPTTAWMFELPIATPQGASVAQFQIDRESPEPGAADPAPFWQVRFAIDIEPLGPVHVHLRTEGERAAVTIWAERDGSLDRLRGEGAELARALPAEVTFRAGAPKRPAPARGRLVDQTS